jgi:glucose/arabinose dehydrogenase
VRLVHVVAVIAVLIVGVGLASPAGAVEAKLVAGGLDGPAAFTFGPAGQIFYGERLTGEIRILDPSSSGSDTLFFDVPNLITDGERGLLGIALHPDYPDQPFVYAYATRSIQGTERNQIVRIRNVGGEGTQMKVIFSTEVAATYHVGGRILFGPDDRLYAIVGEALNPANAQTLGNAAGKILRMTALGKRAPGNPFPKSRIYAYGIRNSYGFAFDPQTGRLWETENGPECNDELNLILAGRNYGWGPSETCDSPGPPTNTNRDGPNPVLPKAIYNPVIAVTGAAFCQACHLGPGSNGRLFVGAYNTGEIRLVTLGAKGLGVVSQRVAYDHSDVVLSMERGPAGRLYFSDSGAIYKLVAG